MEKENTVEWIIAVFQESKAGCYSYLPTSFYLTYKGKYHFMRSWSANRSEDLIMLAFFLFKMTSSPLTSNHSDWDLIQERGHTSVGKG